MYLFATASMGTPVVFFTVKIDVNSNSRKPPISAPFHIFITVNREATLH